MSDLMKLLQAADVAAIDFEKARNQVEIAKQTLDSAKTSFDEARLALDEVIARADDLGIPRVKVRKLVEERTQLIVASGLIGNSEPRTAQPKAPRNSKKLKAVPDSEKDFSDDEMNVSHAAEMN